MNIDKNDVYLPAHPTISDMILSLETIDVLDPKIMQHIAIESISSDPLYMAMGYIAADNSEKCLSDGYLLEWKHVFEQELLHLKTIECNLDALSMANSILQKNRIYLDVSEQYWDKSFTFNRYPQLVEGIDYFSKIGNLTPSSCRLELFMLDDIMYYNRNEWTINCKTNTRIHTGCDHSFHDTKDSLYGFLMYHCSNSTDISRFQSFFKSVNIDITELGKFWLNKWLNTAVELSNHKLFDSKGHTDLLISICYLIDADMSLIKKHVDVIKSLNILSSNNIDLYTQLIYDASKNPSCNIENNEPMDFEILK